MVNGDETPTCVAVLHEDGTKTDVFDAKGRQLTFALGHEVIMGGKKICFSTHGIGNGADGLLTPCFDENGEHGEPEESCFCGIDEPHIHAHVQDPDKCNHSEDLTFLAQLTLYPLEKDMEVSNHYRDCGGESKECTSDKNYDHNHDHNHSTVKKSCCSESQVKSDENHAHDHNHSTVKKSCCSESQVKSDENHAHDHNHSTVKKSCCSESQVKSDDLPLMYMPITENLPDQCNAKDFYHNLKRLSDQGFIVDLSTSAQRKRMFKVQHEDHLDYLCYNSETGNLHLEHPCNSSFGGNDHHGKLQFVTKRELTANDQNSGHNVSSSFKKNITLHFFEVSTRPMQMLEVVKSVFNIDATNRVATVREMSCCIQSANNEPCDCHQSSLLVKNDFTGRSQFLVDNICCSSEVPHIKNIVEPMEGVFGVSINVTTKIVYVDHDTKLLSAEQIAKKLSSNNFGAHLKRDAGKVLMMQTFAPQTTFVSSQLKLQGSSSCYNNYKSAFKEFSEDNLKTVSFDQSSKVLSIEHNPYFISLTMMRSNLTQNAIESEILLDGSADGKWALSLFPNDDNEATETSASGVNPYVLLSGLFWIVSMLSYIGGDW